jgi:hypothetical protein
MGKPKMTRADHDGTPLCPHCGAPLYGATVTIEDLMEHFPFGGRIAIGEDGYAREGEHLTTTCGECLKPVAVGFNSNVEDWYNWQVKLVAARTKKDEEFLNPDPLGQFLSKAVRLQEAIHCGESK